MVINRNDLLLKRAVFHLEDIPNTAALVIPGMILFIAYYFIAIRPRLAPDQRPSVPWLWWLPALILLPVTFFIADPAIWRHPHSLLVQSVLFEWNHSVTGHLRAKYLVRNT